MRLISARLSAKRRSPFAGLVVLLLALVTTAGLYAALSPAQAQKQSASTDEVAKGRALFLVGCSSCHGQNGEGIVTKRGNQYGPSLVGVGAAAVDFQVASGRMPMAQAGAQAVRKKPVYNEEQISQLAAFVASLGPGPAIPTEEQYSPSAIPDEELEESVVRGRQLFFTNCTACHNFAGTGGALSRGKFAPTLMGVPEKQIYEAMLTGPQAMDVFSNENLTPDEKRDIIAFLKTIENEPSYAGFKLGSFGPVSEGMFAWIGVGICVCFGIWIAAHGARSTKKKGAQA